MTTETIHAWMIHKYWSGDTSARVIFFTQEHGVVNGLFKGGRTPKKQALLQPFVPLWLTLNRRGESCFVCHLETCDVSLELAGEALFACLYVNELIFHTLKPFDPHAELYQAYEYTIKALQVDPDRSVLEAILRRFEWVLLKSCGYQMSLIHEAHTEALILENQYYRLIPGEGFVRSKEGIRGSYLLALEAGQFDDVDLLKQVKYFFRAAIDHALDGKIIKTRRLYSSYRL